jgi:spore coat protein CotF
MQQNMHTGTISVNLNHGGHEINDVHEILAETINVLDQFMIFRQYVQDAELLEILDRQYQHILQEYNGLVMAFSKGQAPTPQAKYQSKLPANIVYGLKQMPPKKPNQSIGDVKDQGISGHMLGLIKSSAGLKAIAALEVTNPIVRHTIANSIPCCIEMAYEIFLWQNKHHYYQVPQFPEQDTQQLITSYIPSPGKPQLPEAKNMH